MKYTLLNFKLSDDYEQRVKDYIENGLSNNTIVKVDNIFIDLKSLSIPCNLDCLNCYKVYDINCCGGNPYPPQEESIKFIKEHFDEIFSDPNAGEPEDRARLSKELLDKDFTVLFNNRMWAPGAVRKAEPQPTFPKINTGCIFNVKDGDCRKCAIHAHCLTKNINPVTKKPIYCSLYPVCSIDLNDTEKFLFCILDKDITFNMWQGVDFLSRPCFHKGLLTDPDREYFKDEDYKPAFLSSIDSIEYLLDDKELTNKMIELINNYKGPIGTLE